MNQDTSSVKGILLVDKPKGITSHDVVYRVRKKMQIRKVGHAGTLDPMATGLMIILVGQATKWSDRLMGLDKAYAGTMRLGLVTDSRDAEGEIVSTHSVPDYKESALKDLMKSFEGDQEQIPPMFSAKKVQGKPLYKLARKGKVIQREPVTIKIHSFVFQEWQSPYFSFQVECSKGTYIRQLAHDYGEIVGCGAHLSQLRRLRIGSYSIDQALDLEQMQSMSIENISARLLTEETLECAVK